jgi:tetratricopeptide (TPR) repeat protein
LYLLICAVFLTLVSRYPVAYVQLTYEDMYGEWLQTLLFAGVCILAATLARRRRVYRWFFALLAMAGLYTFMEEISWGQRLFQIESPEFFAENNVQGETNLHNFLTGPESTLLKDLVEYTLAIALVGYGLIYPLALRAGRGLARWLNHLGVAPPPLYLWVFFVTAALLEIGLFKVNEAEVAELLVGTALILMLVYYLTDGEAVAGEQNAAAVSPLFSAAASARCGRTTLALFALLIGLAYLATTSFYSLPGRSERVDARLAKGYAKFARRLEKRQRWHDAAELYLHAYELESNELPLLHQALAAFEADGDTDNYRSYYRVMLDATAGDILKNDASAENLLMLASEYSQIEAHVVAAQYLDQAQSVAVELLSEAASSDGYYWLGRTNQQRGDYAEAMRAYNQALAIEPNRSRNIVALRSLQIEMN